MRSLAPVLSILEEIGSVRSRKEKERILQEGLESECGEYLRKTILYALDAYRQFNVTKLDSTIVNTGISGYPSVDEIFLQLDLLASKKGASQAEKDELNFLCGTDKETLEVTKRIINKDLRCGLGVKTAEKFVEGVKDYGVMKPKTEKKSLLKDFDKFLALAGGYHNICWSDKVDGVRVCDCTVHEDGLVEYTSTNGKPYRNFHCFNPEVIDIAKTIHLEHGVPYPIGFDGEVIDYTGNFQKVVTQTQRDYDVNTSNLRLLIWSVTCPGPFQKRYQMVRENLPSVRQILRQQDLIGPKAKTNVFCLHHYFEHHLKEWKDVELLARRMINTGEEGVVLKVSDHEHERKRSRLWFRLKALYLEGEGVEVDLKVLRAEKGTGKFSEMLGALICDYNGEEVRVGGGFKESQRKEFIDNPPKWITVNADSETDEKSLRFPQFVRAREEK